VSSRVSLLRFESRLRLQALPVFQPARPGDERGTPPAHAPMPCPFCNPRKDLVFHQGTHVLGLWDAFPVAEGHALLITRRHVESWFDATPEERAELMAATDIARRAIEAQHAVHGFNIGLRPARTLRHATSSVLSTSSAVAPLGIGS